MYRLVVSWLIFLLMLPAAGTARAQEPARLALVIGNQSYHSSVGTLKNPHNDIALVGEALARQGFEVLPAVKDARRSTILGAVREFVHRLRRTDTGAIGFIYYSGHGAAEKDTGINYLVPIDAREPGSAVFWDESIKLDEILRILELAPSAAKFVVFDACRNELHAQQGHKQRSRAGGGAPGPVHSLRHLSWAHGFGHGRAQWSLRSGTG
jgi:hypothetical protein